MLLMQAPGSIIPWGSRVKGLVLNPLQGVEQEGFDTASAQEQEGQMLPSFFPLADGLAGKPSGPHQFETPAMQSGICACGIKSQRCSLVMQFQVHTEG